MSNKIYVYHAVKLGLCIEKYEYINETNKYYKVSLDKSLYSSIAKESKDAKAFKTLQEAKEYLIEHINAEIYFLNDRIKRYLFNKDAISKYTEQDFDSL